MSLSVYVSLCICVLAITALHSDDKSQPAKRLVNEKMEVSGPLMIARLQLRWSDVIKRHEGDRSTWRRSIRLGNVEKEHVTRPPK